MRELISSGRIVDLIVALMVSEAAGLLLFYRMTGRGVRPLDALAGLLPGACLLWALRAALTGQAWIWIALALALSLLAHLIDLSRRWHSPPRETDVNARRSETSPR